jgi:hypothetical protein
VGLDVHTVDLLSSLLHRIAKSQSPRIVLSLRPDEHMPQWLTHLICFRNDYTIDSIGAKTGVLSGIDKRRRELNPKIKHGLTEEEAAFYDFSRHIYYNSLCKPESGRTWTRKERTLYDRITADKSRIELFGEEGVEERRRASPRTGTLSRDGFAQNDQTPSQIGEPIVEMNGIRVAYGEQVALGDWQQEHEGALKDGLWWTIRRGQRWGVFGPNGQSLRIVIRREGS